MKDVDAMEHADGEREVELDADGRAKVEAVHELGELIRGRLERAADDVPDTRFAAMWAAVDAQLATPAPAPAPRGRWFEAYRGYVVTAAVSAGAVAALALLLRAPSAPPHAVGGPIEAMPVVHRPSEIEELDTPGGNGTVFNVEDEDGSTTVIWVTPDDTVEGI